MEKTTHQVLIHPEKNFKVEIVGVDDITGALFQAFLRNSAFENGNENEQDFIYSLDNFNILFVEDDDPLSDQKLKTWKNNCKIYKKNDNQSIEPKRVMINGENLEIDIITTDEGNKIMYLPKHGFSGHLVSPIYAKKEGWIDSIDQAKFYSPEEYKMIRNIAYHVNNDLNIKQVSLKTPVNPEIEKFHRHYKIEIEDKKTGESGLFLQLFETQGAWGEMNNSNPLNHIKDMDQALKGINQYVADRKAELDKIAMKYAQMD